MSIEACPAGARSTFPTWNGSETSLPDPSLLRASLRLPELSQGELVRYYTALSERNYGIDSGTYPLGSCTMKYNPKINDLIASQPGFADAHPQAREEDVQGTLRTLLELRAWSGGGHRSAPRQPGPGGWSAGRVGRSADDFVRT